MIQKRRRSKIALRKGEKFRGKRILDVVKLSNGWYIIKTENKKSERDFKVRTILSLQPLRYFTPKHAHFAIDLYGKLCASREKAYKVLSAIIEIWLGSPIREVINKYKDYVEDLPGYDLEYILYALKWIIEQEEINFTGRSERKQQELNEILEVCNNRVLRNLDLTIPSSLPEKKKGSQLVIALLCDIALGTHPVEALLKAGLDIRPIRY